MSGVAEIWVFLNQEILDEHNLSQVRPGQRLDELILVFVSAKCERSDADGNSVRILPGQAQPGSTIFNTQVTLYGVAGPVRMVEKEHSADRQFRGYRRGVLVLPDVRCQVVFSPPEALMEGDHLSFRGSFSIARSFEGSRAHNDAVRSAYSVTKSIEVDHLVSGEPCEWKVALKLVNSPAE